MFQGQLLVLGYLRLESERWVVTFRLEPSWPYLLLLLCFGVSRLWIGIWDFSDR